MKLIGMKDNKLKSFNVNISLLIKSFFVGVLLAEVILIAKVFTERLSILLNEEISYFLIIDFTKFRLNTKRVSPQHVE